MVSGQFSNLPKRDTVGSAYTHTHDHIECYKHHHFSRLLDLFKGQQENEKKFYIVCVQTITESFPDLFLI